MAPKHDIDHEHYNPSDAPPNPSFDCKLVTHEAESIPSVAMQDQDHTAIMDELSAMVRSDCNTVQGFIKNMVGNTDASTNQSKPSMPESTLHRISKMIMKEAVEDKKMELTYSGLQISENDVDVLSLFDTSKLYGLINDNINKYNHRNTAHGVTNNMVGITNVPTTVHSNNEATYAEQEEINDLNEDLSHLRHKLRGNMDNDDYVSHDETIPANNVLKSNNTIGAHIVVGKEDSFYDWVDTYDELNGYYHTPTEEDEPGSSHTFTSDNNIYKMFMGDNDIFQITKIKHNGISKIRLVSGTSTSVNSGFYIGESQK